MATKKTEQDKLPGVTDFTEKVTAKKRKELLSEQLRVHLYTSTESERGESSAVVGTLKAELVPEHRFRAPEAAKLVGKELIFTGHKGALEYRGHCKQLTIKAGPSSESAGPAVLTIVCEGGLARLVGQTLDIYETE